MNQNTFGEIIWTFYPNWLLQDAFFPLLKWKCGQIIAKTRSSHSKLLECHSPAIQHLLCGLINSRKNNNKNVVEQNVCKATRISRTVQTCLQTPGNLQDLRFAAKIHSESEPSMAAAESITTITKEERQTIQMSKMTKKNLREESEREAQPWKMSPVSIHLSPKLAATGWSCCETLMAQNRSCSRKNNERKPELIEEFQAQPTEKWKS